MKKIISSKYLFLFLMCISPALFAQHSQHAASAPTAVYTTEKKSTSKLSLLKAKKIVILHGESHIINLTVGYKTVNFAGKKREAIAVNNQIPAPTLHFKVGDHVTINVYNHLKESTAIHWHGLLVPWQMDGVEGVSQKAIPPGGVFHYQFTLRQSGTYWYHAHAGLQEQEGFYGAFLIDPAEPPHYQYNKDFVIVLSDWSNTSAENILKNLKKEGDYYSPEFPLQPSLMKLIHDYRKADSTERKKLIDDYKMMQQMRMSIYDLSDVAYDAYLLNGHAKSHPWTSRVKVGDVVRLRFIGAPASTIYNVKIPGAKIEIVHVQGNDVTPYRTNYFSIAPGETIDMLVKIQKNQPYVIYAESIDTRGVAIGALLTNPNQAINYKQITPFPEPKPVTREMMMNMMASEQGKSGEEKQKKSHDMGVMSQHSMQKMNGMGKASGDMKMDNAKSMDHSISMTMPTEPTIIGDTISPPNSYQATTAGTKYQDLIAAVKTNNPNKPVTGIIRMELFGYMDRFIWFVNGLPEYKMKPIQIQPGKRYHIIFTNNSMMRHPMHIHGHWFILRNGHGAYDPLLHTIEVPPGATVVADIDTDASGQWFFHCHHLYHMMTGMSRVFQYETIIDVAKGAKKPENFVSQTAYINRPIVREDEVMPIDSSLINHPMAHPAGFWLANFLDIGEDPFHHVQEVTFKGLYGGDYNKLELLTEDAEMNKGKLENAAVDIFYWHLINQFWAIKGGVNYFNEPATTPYWQPGIGIEGLMPYFIDTDFRTYYHDDSVKFDIELFRDTQITNNFFVRLGIRSMLATKTVIQDDIGSGLNQIRYIVRPYYRVAPGLNLFSEFEHDKNYGAFKNIRSNLGEPASENTITFGVSVLF